MKRVLCMLLLVIVMLIGFIPIAAIAHEELPSPEVVSDHEEFPAVYAPGEGDAIGVETDEMVDIDAAYLSIMPLYDNRYHNSIDGWWWHSSLERRDYGYGPVNGSRPGTNNWRMMPFPVYHTQSGQPSHSSIWNHMLFAGRSNDNIINTGPLSRPNRPTRPANQTLRQTFMVQNGNQAWSTLSGSNADLETGFRLFWNTIYGAQYHEVVRNNHSAFFGTGGRPVSAWGTGLFQYGFFQRLMFNENRTATSGITASHTRLVLMGNLNSRTAVLAATGNPRVVNTFQTQNFPTPTRTGYVFGGWFTSRARADGTGEANRVFQDQIVPGGLERTLFARWNPRVTFVLNGGNVNGSTLNVETDPINRGTAITQARVPIPERTNYTFAGWRWTGGTGFTNGTYTRAQVGNHVVREARTYTAQWTRNTRDVTYTVTGIAPTTFSPTLASLGSSPGVGTTVTRAGALTTTSTVHNGQQGVWRFNGWSTTDVTMSPNPGTGGTFTMPNHNVRFTGTWTFTATQRTVTYTVTGIAPATSTPTLASLGGTFANGATVTRAGALTTTSTVHNGQQGVWTFNGWNVPAGVTLSGGTGNPGTGGTFSMPNHDVTFTGTWTFTATQR
ncbi:MAG: SHIRT domain-containing protein, partial [Oscillospiraceae bacterium]|nr:SHIRT domain-containing protein [Oscillospiraceae bacterium]